MANSPLAYYSSQYLEPAFNAEDAITVPVNLVASAGLIARGTVLGELTSTPGTFKVYASGNSDGSQVAKALLMYDVYVDASGNITLTTTNGQIGGMVGQSPLGKTVPAYISGYFRAADLTGLDAGAVTALGARFTSGSLAQAALTTTILCIPG